MHDIIGQVACIYVGLHADMIRDMYDMSPHGGYIYSLNVFCLINIHFNQSVIFLLFFSLHILCLSQWVWMRFSLIVLCSLVALS